MDEREDRGVPVDGGNTNRKEKRGRSRESILTKESFCAVFALFGMLCFFILVSNDAVFGEPGAYVHDLLLGTFGYAAYPLMLLLAYACIAGFLGKRIFKRRALALSLAFTVAVGFLTAHTVQTYYVRGWENEGYLSLCFQAGDSAIATFGGLVAALPVYGLTLLTTKIGALVILSAATILGVYISGRLIFKNVSLVERKQAQKLETQSATLTEDYPQEYGQAYAQAMPAAQQPSQGYGQAERQVHPQAYDSAETQYASPSNTPVSEEVPPMPGYSEAGTHAQNMGGYAPYVPYTVRQQPGFKLPSGGQAEPQSVKQEAVGQSAPLDSRTYSPFGVATPSQQVSRPLTQEESRKILFSGTPQQNYQDNLIFDGTARVNQRDFSGNVPPAATPAAPVTQQPVTYSEQYRRSVQDSTPVRPQRLAGDSGENFGRRTANPYGLDVPAEHSYDSDRAASARVPESSGTPIFRTPIDERTEHSGVQFSQPVQTPQPQKPASGVEEGRGERGYSDSVSRQTPTSFGQTGNRGKAEDDEVAVSDRSSLFDEEPSVEELPSVQPSKDAYTLRSYEEEPRVETPRSTESERDTASQCFTRSAAMDSSITPSAERMSLVDRTPLAETGRTSSTERFCSAETGRAVPAPSTPIQAPKAEERVEETPPPKPRIRKPYVRVPLHYFNCSDNLPDSDAAEVEEIKTRILETLEDYNVAGGSIASVTFGPTVTRYNVVLPRGVSPKKVVSLEQEIAMGLCREGVNVYLNVESGAVSIEVPNRIRQTVELGSMFIDDAYTKAKPTSLVFAMGKDIANRKVYGDVCKMTHLLVAGSSGSGKSVFLGCLIISLITKYSPDEMRLILIDPKKTEFVLYNNLPHLMVNEIITDCKKAVQSLSWAIGEMERRYSLIEKMSLSGTYVVNIDEYNAHVGPGEEKLPKIVIIVDELADLMLNAKKDMEDKIQSLTQKARAAGIHLILATQRPSTDVITGVIKSNLPTRIAFTVATDVDSRVILDQTGAQKLLGKGDMIYTASGINTPVRVQSPFISSADSQKVVNFIKENNEAFFDESATTFINNARSGAGAEGGDGNGLDVEPVYLEALKLVIQTQTASISMVQRKCSVGFNKAAKIIEWMEQMEFISPYEGAKARTVFITQERFVELFGEW